MHGPHIEEGPDQRSIAHYAMHCFGALKAESYTVLMVAYDCYMRLAYAMPVAPIMSSNQISNILT